MKYQEIFGDENIFLILGDLEILQKSIEYGFSRVRYGTHVRIPLISLKAIVIACISNIFYKVG